MRYGIRITRKPVCYGKTVRVQYKASSGWLRKFKRRHGIRELHIQGESLSADSSAADKFKESFTILTKLAYIGKHCQESHSLLVEKTQHVVLEYLKKELQLRRVLMLQEPMNCHYYSLGNQKNRVASRT